MDGINDFRLPVILSIVTVSRAARCCFLNRNSTPAAPYCAFRGFGTAIIGEALSIISLARFPENKNSPIQGPGVHTIWDGGGPDHMRFWYCTTYVSDFWISRAWRFSSLTVQSSIVFGLTSPYKVQKQ
jgi:hypothetical protein